MDRVLALRTGGAPGVNRSKVRDPRFWRRWALSGAMGFITPAGMSRARAWSEERKAGFFLGRRRGDLRVLAECMLSWAKCDPSTARRGDSWPVYAAAAPADFDGRCRKLAMLHGARLPGVCRACGAKFMGCLACFGSGCAPRTAAWSAARDRVRAQLGADAVALWTERARRPGRDDG